MTSQQPPQTFDDKAYQDMRRDISLPLDDPDSLAKHLICEETRLEDLSSVTEDSYPNPASIRSQGNSVHTDDIYGNPASIGENSNGSVGTNVNCGNPGSGVSFGNPQSAGDYHGNPSSVGRYSNPVTPCESGTNDENGGGHVSDSIDVLPNKQVSQPMTINSTNQEGNLLTQGAFNVADYQRRTDHNATMPGQQSTPNSYYPNQMQPYNQISAPNHQQQYQQPAHSLSATSGVSVDHMRKKRRFEYQNWQIEYLEKVYQTNHYPGKYVKDEMSAVLKLSPDRIKSWFQNRRCRDRKRLKGHLTPGAPIPQGSVARLGPILERRLPPSSSQWGPMVSSQIPNQPQQIRQPPQQYVKGVSYDYPLYYGNVTQPNPQNRMTSDSGSMIGTRPPQPGRMVLDYPLQRPVINHSHPAFTYGTFSQIYSNQSQLSRAHSEQVPPVMIPVSSDEDSSSTEDDVEDGEDEGAKNSQQTLTKSGLITAASTPMIEQIKTAGVWNVANPSGTYVNAGSPQDMTSYMDPRIRSIPEYVMQYGAQSRLYPTSCQRMQVSRGYSNQGYMNMQQFTAAEQWRQAYYGHYMYQNNSRFAVASVPSAYHNFYSATGQKDPNSLYNVIPQVQSSGQGASVVIGHDQSALSQIPNTYTEQGHNAVTTNTTSHMTQDYATATRQTSLYQDLQDYTNNHQQQLEQYINMFNSQHNLPSVEAYPHSSSTSTTDSQDNELSRTPTSPHQSDLQSPQPTSPVVDTVQAQEHSFAFETPITNPVPDLYNVTEPKTGTNTDLPSVSSTAEYSSLSQDSVGATSISSSYDE